MRCRKRRAAQHATKDADVVTLSMPPDAPYETLRQHIMRDSAVLCYRAAAVATPTFIIRDAPRHAYAPSVCRHERPFVIIITTTLFYRRAYADSHAERLRDAQRAARDARVT